MALCRRCGRERLAAHPRAADEVVAGRELHGEETEAAIDAAQTGSRQHRGARLGALVSVTEVVTGVRVLALQIMEGETLTHRRVDRSHLVHAGKRIQAAAIVAELLVNVLQDAPGEFRGRRGSQEARCAGREPRSSDDLVASGGDILVLVGVRPHPLGILGENADDVLDLILNLPSELKVVQANVGRVQGRFLEAGRAQRDAEVVDGLARRLAGSTGFAIRAFPCREGHGRTGERALVDRVLIFRPLTIHPLLFGQVFQVEVAVDDVFGNIVADQASVLDEQCFDVITRHNVCSSLKVCLVMRLLFGDRKTDPTHNLLSSLSRNRLTRDPNKLSSTGS